MNSFLSIQSKEGLAWEEDDPLQFPSCLHLWSEHPLLLPSIGTHFIYLYQGSASLEWNGIVLPLKEGMFASVPGQLKIYGGAGIAITRLEFEGCFLLGGPVEERGRLKYIDGCTDSLILPPSKLGDPCLNLLHIPANTHQSRHTHPSHRVGMIISGRGQCITPTGDHPLHPGLTFVIPADSAHSFHTSTEDLRVIAYHPETDFGPTDEVHPMVNRTLLETP